MMSGDHSVLWPASAGDPFACTLLTVDDLIEAGGGMGLRTYLAERLAAVATMEPAAPGVWVAEAVQHVTELAADRTGDIAHVSTSALQMILAYIEYLEGAVEAGEPA